MELTDAFASLKIGQHIIKYLKQLAFSSLFVRDIYCTFFSFPHPSHTSGPPCDMWSLGPIHYSLIKFTAMIRLSTDVRHFYNFHIGRQKSHKRFSSYVTTL